MRITVLEETGIRDGAFHLSHGDVVTVPDEVGARWCGLGWAEDEAGKVPTGERSLAPVALQPHPVRSNVKG